MARTGGQAPRIRFQCTGNSMEVCPLSMVLSGAMAWACLESRHRKNRKGDRSGSALQGVLALPADDAPWCGSVCAGSRCVYPHIHINSGVNRLWPVHTQGAWILKGEIHWSVPCCILELLGRGVGVGDITLLPIWKGGGSNPSSSISNKTYPSIKL